MGLVDFGIPKGLTLAAKAAFGIEHFVETGTYRGDTAAFAAGHFQRVYTVEFDATRHAQAVARFRGSPQVTCLQGHSPAALRQIVAELGTAPALFWLDAHWCGDAASYAAGDPCPVEAELAVLNESTADAFLLVDDARLFLAPPEAPHDPDRWPNLARLIPLLAHADRRYVVAVDDVLVAFPARAKDFLIQWCRSRPAAWGAGQTTPQPATPARGPVFFVNRQASP